jgi:mannosyltransferase OCH1-like enzyme
MPIPRIIHQVWFKFPNGSETPPSEYTKMRQSWVTAHPGWEFRLWNSTDARAFVVQHFPHMVKVYDDYKAEISRVDAIRYFLLAVLGGFYVDMDTECITPLDPLLDNKAVLVVDVNKLLILNNGFMGAEPNHPLMIKCANNLGKSAWMIDVMMMTGPLYLGFNWLSHKDKNGIEVLSVKELNRYFHHRHDASWTPIAQLTKALNPERRKYMTIDEVPWYLRPFLQGKVGSLVQ